MSDDNVFEGINGDVMAQKPKISRARKVTQPKTPTEVATDIEVHGLERFPEAIPADAITDHSHFLFEIIDDFLGWRILSGGMWHPIKYLKYDGGENVSVLAGDRVDSYPKDTTPVVR
jgi:hypothetical protein